MGPSVVPHSVLSPQSSVLFECAPSALRGVLVTEEEQPMTRLKLGFIFAVLAISTVAFAQKSTLNATQSREDLRSILRNYPPQLATVLRLDPTLLTNQAYLATYPDLTAFITQHPDGVHYPGYFFRSQELNPVQG